MTNEFPTGWNNDRVKAVLDFYENQTEDEELAELEAAWASEDATLVAVPKALVSAVRSLISHYESLRAS